MSVKKGVLCPLTRDKLYVWLCLGCLQQGLFAETFEKGEKHPVGRGSRTPASRYLWLLLVLRPYRQYCGTRSSWVAAERPVSIPKREVGESPCLWLGTGWQEKFTMDTCPLLGAGWAAWDLQEEQKAVKQPAASYCLTADCLISSFRLPPELSGAPGPFGNESWR